MALPPTVAKYFPDAEPVYPDSLRADPLEIDQLAILVDDIDEAIEYLARAYGWGPFYKASHNDKAWFKGELKTCHFHMAFCLVGKLEIELVQYVSGECTFMNAQPGLHHIRLPTKDMSAEVQKQNKVGDTAPIWGIQVDGQFVGVCLESNRLKFTPELFSV